MDSRLGAFGPLPREIRGALFKECVNQRTARSLACTSSKIYEELTYFMYDQMALIFDIDPADTSSNVRILNDQGKHWGWKPRRKPIMTSQVHVKEMDETRSMPLEKFKRIVIQLHAPDPQDPGQLVRGWLQITRLLSLLLPQREYHYYFPQSASNFVPGQLNQGYNLPEVCIRVLDTRHFCWTRGRADRRFRRLGVEEKDLADRLYESSRLNTFLIPFRQVRRARSLTVELPKSVVLDQEPMLRAEISLLSELGPLRNVFGQNFEEDSKLCQFESEIDLRLDYEMDFLEGDAARQLRRAWLYQICDYTVAAYSRWRWGMTTISDGVDDTKGSRVFGGCEPLLDRETRDLVNEAWIERMKDWAILSPTYVNDRIAWKDYYPGGIPHMGTRKYAAMLAELDRGGPISFEARLRDRECEGCRKAKRRENERWVDDCLSPVGRE